MRHMLVGVQFIVEMITVENENTFQCLEFKWKTASKTFRFHTNIVCNISRNLRDERIINLLRIERTIEYIKDNHRFICNNTSNRVQIHENRFISSQNAWSCSMGSRMNCQKVTSMQSVLCHQSRHGTDFLNDFTIGINSIYTFYTYYQLI